MPWLRSPLKQVGEQLIDLGDAHAALGYLRRQHQVLLDVEAGEDAALLGHIAQPGLSDPMERQTEKILPPQA